MEIFFLSSRYQNYIFHVCRTHIVRAALVWLVSLSYRTRVILVALVLLVSGTRVVKQTISVDAEKSKCQFTTKYFIFKDALSDLIPFLATESP